VITEPTSEQRQAFDLIGAPIPLALKQPEQRPPSAAASQVSAELGFKPPVTSG
jgi:hypothetical protein